MKVQKPARYLPYYCLITICLYSLFSCTQPQSRESERPHIAYITNGVASFWSIAKVGAEKAAQDLAVDVTIAMPAEGINDQKRIVEDLLTKGVDGIAISLIDANNQTSLVNEAAKQTKLITQDADAPLSDRLAYVGMDNYLAGRMLGALVKENLPGGGTIALFVGRIEQDNARKRRQGVIDEILGRAPANDRFDSPGVALSKGSYTILPTQTDQFDRVKAKANCEDTLLKNPSLSAMVGLFAYNAPACLEALKQADRVNKVKLFSFDEADETLSAIEDGTMLGTVVQNPYEYGYQSVKLLKEIIAGNLAAIPANKFIDIPARRIDRSNIVQFRKELNTQLGHK